MDNKEKSSQYFNKHSSTGLNHNGYWNHDYKTTADILLDKYFVAHVEFDKKE